MGRVRFILVWTCVVLSCAVHCSCVWTCWPLRSSLLQVLFPEKSSKRGEIKSASVTASDSRVGAKVAFLCELGMFACVCVRLSGSRCGLYHQPASPPTRPGNCPGCRRLATPLAVSTLTPRSRATGLLLSQPVSAHVCVFTMGLLRKLLWK